MSEPGLYILDTTSREYRPVPEDWMNFDGWEYNLEDGNFSCDCNRSILFKFDPDTIECGDDRFILIADAGYVNERFHPSTIKAYMVKPSKEESRWT